MDEDYEDNMDGRSDQASLEGSVKKCRKTTKIGTGTDGETDERCGGLKRRYCCPGKRRYKAKKKCCCTRNTNTRKINTCVRNWTRISVDPFYNFMRVFRRRFSKDTPHKHIQRLARCQWKKMSKCSKKYYYEQAKRARLRGYRT